jgi:hypothetical protein
MIKQDRIQRVLDLIEEKAQNYASESGRTDKSLARYALRELVEAAIAAADATRTFSYQTIQNAQNAYEGCECENGIYCCMQAALESLKTAS